LNSSCYYSHNNDYILFRSDVKYQRIQLQLDSIISRGDIWYLYGKNEFQICMERVSVDIIGDNLFFDNDLRLPAKLYNLITESWINISPNIRLCDNVCQLSNGIVLSSLYNTFRKHQSLVEFIQWLKGDIVVKEKTIPLQFTYFIDNNEIIAKSKISSDFISEIIIYDLNCCEKYRVNISQYMIKAANIASVNVIYFWDNKTILVIDGGNIIAVVENKYHVKVYSRYYNIFINSQLSAFQIVDNCLVPFVFKYDFWRDDDKPENINNIINLLIDLDFFSIGKIRRILPMELCNIVYCELVNMSYDINQVKI